MFLSNSLGRHIPTLTVGTGKFYTGLTSLNSNYLTWDLGISAEWVPMGQILKHLRWRQTEIRWKIFIITGNRSHEGPSIIRESQASWHPLLWEGWQGTCDLRKGAPTGQKAALRFKSRYKGEREVCSIPAGAPDPLWQPKRVPTDIC